MWGCGRSLSPADHTKRIYCANLPAIMVEYVQARNCHAVTPPGKLAAEPEYVYVFGSRDKDMLGTRTYRVLDEVSETIPFYETGGTKYFDGVSEWFRLLLVERFERTIR